MIADATNPVPDTGPSKPRRWRRLLWFGSISALVAAAVLSPLVLIQKPPPPMRVALGKGQILQIERVTYGTRHRIGRGIAFLEPWSRKWPTKLRNFLGLNTVSTIDVSRPALVVWVNALDSTTGTNMDCGGIQVQLVDTNGEVYPDEFPRRFTSPGFWRQGHVFYNYPKDQARLKLEAMSFRNFREPIVNLEFSNPHVVQPAKWSAAPLPQSRAIGDVEVVLAGLTVDRVPVTRSRFPNTLGIPQPSPPGPMGRTMEEMKAYSDRIRKASEDRMNSFFRQGFRPVWECREQGKPSTDWSVRDWMTEDALGNRDRYGKLREPVLKFIASAYPSATNVSARVIAALPPTDLTTLSTNLWWNQKNSFASNEIVTLGLFLPGTHRFSNDVYQSSRPYNPPANASLRGLTGWEIPKPSTVAGLPPRDHSAARPVIYVQVLKLFAPDQLGLRLRDNHDRYWIAKADPMGRVHAFQFDLPSDVTNVVPEVVLLKPVHAEFLVETKRYLKP